MRFTAFVEKNLQVSNIIHCGQSWDTNYIIINKKAGDTKFRLLFSLEWYLQRWCIFRVCVCGGASVEAEFPDSSSTLKSKEKVGKY